MGDPGLLCRYSTEDNLGPGASSRGDCSWTEESTLRRRRSPDCDGISPESARPPPSLPGTSAAKTPPASVATGACPRGSAGSRTQRRERRNSGEFPIGIRGAR